MSRDASAPLWVPCSLHSESGRAPGGGVLDGVARSDCHGCLVAQLNFLSGCLAAVAEAAGGS